MRPCLLPLHARSLEAWSCLSLSLPLPSFHLWVCLLAYLLQMGYAAGRTLAEADVFVYRRWNVALLQMAGPSSKRCTLTPQSCHLGQQGGRCPPLLALPHVAFWIKGKSTFSTDWHLTALENPTFFKKISQSMLYILGRMVTAIAWFECNLAIGYV